MVKQRRLGHRPLPYLEARTLCQHRPVQQGEEDKVEEGGSRLGAEKCKILSCYKMHDDSKDKVLQSAGR